MPGVQPVDDDPLLSPAVCTVFPFSATYDALHPPARPPTHPPTHPTPSTPPWPPRSSAAAASDTLGLRQALRGALLSGEVGAAQALLQVGIFFAGWRNKGGGGRGWGRGADATAGVQVWLGAVESRAGLSLLVSVGNGPAEGSYRYTPQAAVVGVFASSTPLLQPDNHMAMFPVYHTLPPIPHTTNGVYSLPIPPPPPPQEHCWGLLSGSCGAPATTTTTTNSSSTSSSSSSSAGWGAQVGFHLACQHFIELIR
jgi:hypothetical protein